MLGPMVEAREQMETLLLRADDWEEMQRLHKEIDDRERRKLSKNRMFRKLRHLDVPAKRAYIGARMCGMQLLRLNDPQLKYWAEFLKSRTDEQFQSLREAFGV